MSDSAAAVTAADIARRAGVTRATVSNWRRRYEDFPAAVGGTETSPTYDLMAVEDWLRSRDQLPDPSPEDRIRRFLADTEDSGSKPTTLERGLLFLLYLHRDGRAPDGSALPRWTDVGQLDDSMLAIVLTQHVPTATTDVPGSAGVVYCPQDAPLMRALAELSGEHGPSAVFGFLTARPMEENTNRGLNTTPRALADLMAAVACTGPRTGAPATVFDPACGTGSLLDAARRQGATVVYGQEIASGLALHSAVRLGLALSPGWADVRCGDSLRGDRFPGLTADLALSNPPFNAREWGRDELAVDPRWEYGVPPKTEPELAWAQHALAHLRPGGRAVILMPPSVASRSAGRRIRAELLRKGALRAVFALPAGAAQPAHIGLHLWALERPEPGERPSGQVLFADASTAGQGAGEVVGPRDQQRTWQWDAVTATVLSAWRDFTVDPEGFEPRPGVRYLVQTIDLLDDTVDLTPARHLPVEAVGQGPEDVMAGVADARAGMHGVLGRLAGLLPDEGWGAPAPGVWRTTTVGELARTGSITVIRNRGLATGRRAAATPDVEQSELLGSSAAVLTTADILLGRPASGTVDQDRADRPVLRIRAGDVLLPGTLGAGGPFAVRVADEADARTLLSSHVHLVRPDPERIDPWFLAGFLAAPGNLQRAAVGTSIVRVDVRRLELPLLPLSEQRHYGTAFQQLHDFTAATRQAGELGEALARRLSDGMTSGVLRPAR